MSYRMFATLPVAAAAALTALNSAGAVPIYDVTHLADGYGNTGPSETVGPQNTPIDYNFPYQVTYFTGANYGEVYADVIPGSIGIYAHTYNNGVYAPQRQEVYAKYRFDVLFISPTSDPIDVVMNLDLSGVISAPLYLYSTLQVDAGLTSGSTSSGEYREILDPMSTSPTRSGMLSGFTADGTSQSISTGVLTNVPVNVPVQMYVQLNTIQPYTVENPTISFGNTMTLAQSGDVFTILGPNAEQITVNSTDAGIVDNQFSLVPEPSTLTMMWVGLLAMAIGGTRRSGNRPDRRVRFLPPAHLGA